MGKVCYGHLQIKALTARVIMCCYVSEGCRTFPATRILATCHCLADDRCRGESKCTNHGTKHRQQGLFDGGAQVGSDQGRCAPCVVIHSKPRCEI